MLADGSVFEGELIGAAAPAASPPARSCSTRRCPAIRRSSPTPATPGRSSRSPTRTSATTASTPPTTSPVAPSAAASSCVTWPAGTATIARRATSIRCSNGTASPGSPASTPADSPDIIRDTGAMPGAFGEAPEADLRGGGRGRARHRRHRPRRAGHHARALHCRRRRWAPPSDRRLRLRDQVDDRAALSRLGRVEVVPASTSAADVLARRPDGVFLSNGPGDPEIVQYAADKIAQLIGKVPVFGICLGHQLLGLAARRRHGEAAVRPPRRQPPGQATWRPTRSRSPARTTTSRSTPTRWLARQASEMTHVNLNDGVVRGFRRSSASGPSACSITPRPAPARTTARYLFDRLRPA